MSLPSDDLLSAFHDGEVTAAERAVVEQRLATAADARRELSETRQLSSLLKELPGERLPSEFPQQVLQAIEREMLIPSRTADSLESAPSRTASSRGWVGVAAVLTSAAGLLLLMRALDERSEPGAAHDRRLAGSPMLLNAPAESSGAPALAMDDTATLSRQSDAATGAAGQNSVVMNAPANTFGRARFGGGFGGENLFFDQSALGAAEVGQVLRAAQEVEGNEVAVIYLTVVDRQEGIDGLQLLLTKNHIEAERETDATKKSDRQSAPAAEVDQMQAVLVRSNVAQLETALQQLRQERFLRSLEVYQPILLAQLEVARAALADQVTAQEMKRAESKTLVESSSATRRAKSAQAEPSAKSPAPAAPAAKPAPAGAAADKPNESRDTQERFAMQVPMEIAPQVLQQNQLAQQNRSRGLPKGGARGPATLANKDTAAKKETDSATAQRPVQVLFVVVDQAQAAKQQLSPSNSSKPAAAPEKPRTKSAKPNGQDGAA